ncbi:MAG: helix-turn-helix transcriptional regulator [Clostridiales bacterium]|nr:helix-turn-helix transcriptional regulator [Clostridiales bacterium]
MEYKKIGKRLKEYREKAGFTQEALAEAVGCSSTYISALERGAAFPRGDKLIALLNTLKTSADSIFCDVVDCSSEYKASVLSEKLSRLPTADRQRILEMVELMIQQTNVK